MSSLPQEKSSRIRPQQLFASTQCAITTATHAVSSQWITTQVQLDQLYSQLNGHILGAEKPAASKLDFNTSAVLLLQMGRKPTGGYGLQLPAQELVINDGVAMLKVTWTEPAPGAIVTQMLTNPCLLVRMPLGEYRHVNVIDQNNNLRTRLTF